MAPLWVAASWKSYLPKLYAGDTDLFGAQAPHVQNVAVFAGDGDVGTEQHRA
jgi:hypothetical protein